MKNTNIQWCHSTINPVMGCDGCELWPPASAFVRATLERLRDAGVQDPRLRGDVSCTLGSRLTSEIYQDREAIADALMAKLRLEPHHRQPIIDVIREKCKCYAGMLGTMRGGQKGYAEVFDTPHLYPGRMAKAANWGPPTAAEIVDKPWLAGMPRLIFISDMGDALSKSVPFDYLKREIIGNVVSPAGQRHVWLWLSKRAERMAEFGNWLLAHGGTWPTNLVAMTTVTSGQLVSRVDALRRVPAKLKGLSIEPLFERVDFDMAGVDWVIVGGGSDVLAHPFEVQWALDLHAQCQEHGVAFFLKQLGRVPHHDGRPLELEDGHGGDWNEWPKRWRVRQLPQGFAEVVRDASIQSAAA